MRIDSNHSAINAYGRTGVGNAINAYRRSGGIGAGAAHLLNRGVAGQVSGDLISLVKRDANNEPAATYEASPKTYANQAPAGSFNATNFENMLKNWIKDAMNKTGIGFQDIEDIEIGLNERGQMTVNGLKNDSDNQKLAEALNNIVSEVTTMTASGKKLSVSPDTPWVTTKKQADVQRMFYRNSDYAMSATDEFERDKRATLIGLKDAVPQIIESMGIDLDLSQLYRTEEGKIAGYPEKAAWYFETDIAKPNIYGPSKRTKEENNALLIRDYANMFLDAGYDNIPNVNELNAAFKFNKSNFMDLNVLA